MFPYIWSSQSEAMEGKSTNLFFPKSAPDFLSKHAKPQQMHVQEQWKETIPYGTCLPESCSYPGHCVWSSSTQRVTHELRAKSSPSALQGEWVTLPSDWTPPVLQFSPISGFVSGFLNLSLVCFHPVHHLKKQIVFLVVGYRRAFLTAQESTVIGQLSVRTLYFCALGPVECGHHSMAGMEHEEWMPTFGAVPACLPLAPSSQSLSLFVLNFGFLFSSHPLILFFNRNIAGGKVLLVKVGVLFL